MLVEGEEGRTRTLVSLPQRVPVGPLGDPEPRLHVTLQTLLEGKKRGSLGVRGWENRQGQRPRSGPSSVLGDAGQMGKRADPGNHAGALDCESGSLLLFQHLPPVRCVPGRVLCSSRASVAPP